MTKLSDRHRGPRTGQNGILPMAQPGVPVGALTPNGGNYMNPNYPQQQPPGSCGPMPQAQPQTWGAACPPGYCDSATLAHYLGRLFAGESMGCKESVIWEEITLDGAGDGTFTGNSIITMCATRVIAIGTDDNYLPTAGGYLTDLTFGNSPQIAGAPLPLAVLAPDSYGIIPFVTDCLRAGFPWSFTVTGGPDDGRVQLGLIGPAAG